MKGGVASMVLAAIDHARRTPATRGFSLALTSSEESGCQGAVQLRQTGLLPGRPILIVGESTSNMLKLGHKGATWLRAIARGIAAHGSRPDLGVNAILALLNVAAAVTPLAPAVQHGRLGVVTTNIGTIEGGTQTNMVPVEATLTIDLRTVPGADVDRFERELRALLPDGDVQRFLDLAPVWTDETRDLTANVGALITSVTGRVQHPSGTSYFTDAAVLADPAEPSVFIVGPGDANEAHTADESCSLVLLNEAVEIYSTLLSAWNLRRF